jgi:hypothetical protein
VDQRGIIRLETHDVPAFVTEDFMPPEDAMKYRVEFIYEGEGSRQREPAAYWKAFAKRYERNLLSFVSAKGVLEAEVARLVQPGDSKEAVARKLYARAQQIRNLSFERQATEQETAREKREEINSAKEVLKYGYAYADQVTWLLYGLLRAAKLDVSMVLVSTRDDHLFDPAFMNSGQLNTCVLLVKLDTDGAFLDPGTPYLPFAYLPWSETAVKGLRLGGDGQWLTTSLPSADESRVERKATVKLAAGTIEGKLTVKYSGLEAAWRRLNQRNEDALERKRFLENEVEYDVPTGIDVKLTNEPDWTATESDLVAEFDFRVPGWAVTVGNRALLPLGLFGGSEKRTFEHSARVHPLYFSFPYRHTDEVAVELPSGWQVSSVPKERAADIKVASYKASAQANGTTLNMRREFVMNGIFIQQKFYAQVRDFYQAVRAGDEEQTVVTRGSPSAAAKKD